MYWQDSMLPAQHRLRKKKDFEKIFKEGKSRKQGFLFGKFLSNNLKESRFGLVVGTKVSKKAVVRNKIRRRLREILRVNLGKIKKGIDVVIVALPGTEGQDYTEIEEDLTRLLMRAGLFKENSPQTPKNNTFSTIVGNVL